MRYSRVEFDTASSLTVSHLILPASTARVRVTFFPGNAGRCTLTNTPPAVAGQGLTIILGGDPVELEFSKDGEVVQLEWYAIYDGAGATPISWIQVLG